VVDGTKITAILSTVIFGLTTFRHCCLDYDGGGPPDDGILVIAAPPDRIHAAAIYELR
jgi:hypothetical protein